MISTINRIISTKHGLLYTALVCGIICSLCQLFFSMDLYRDSANVYACMVRSLTQGRFTEAFHENIPHLNICCSYLFSLLGIAPEKTLLLVSCLFYLGTIVYLFFLTREFLPEKMAGLGALLFALAPKIIRFFCAALIDSAKCFFLVVALYYGYKLIKSRFNSWGSTIGFGTSLGLLSLARSESLGNACALGLCIGIFGIAEAFRSKRFIPVLLPLFSGGLMALFLISRVVIIGIFRGKWIYDGRIAQGLAKIFPQLSTAAESATANTVPIREFDNSWEHLVEQNVRASYEAYLPFSLAGVLLLLLVLFRKNISAFFPDKKVPDFIKWNNYYWVFFVVLISNMLIFKTSGILAYRYFLLNIPVLMVFTLTGIFWTWQHLNKFVTFRLALPCLIILMLLQAGNGIEYSPQHLINYNTGLYLKQTLLPGKTLAIGKAASVWYYSGLERAQPIETPPVNLAEFNDFRYIICPIKDKRLKIIEARKDLQEIKLPIKSTVKVFEKIR